MEKPNILLVISDHLSPRVIGAYNEDPCRTPAMDRVAAEGFSFGMAYTNCPICQPSRASFWTGCYPHETNVRSNGRAHENGPLPEHLTTLGEQFSNAGYEAVHFGKEHDFGTLRGFKRVEKGSIPLVEEAHPAWKANQETEIDNDTTAKVTDWLRERSSETPFIAVADLQNPHNICSWIGDHSCEGGPVQNVMPPDGQLPELPPNFETEDMGQRPRAIQYLCCSHRRQRQAAKWNADNFKHYYAAYRHYTEVVDGHINQILETLEEQGYKEDTLLVIMADHGDMMASHRMVTKQVCFYEEVTRVPFICAGPGVAPKGVVDRDSLVSLIDLLPTLCDYAGIQSPNQCRGRSILPLLNNQDFEQNSYIASEWHTEWGFTVSPGRMIRSKRFKYTRYLEENAEELYDLENDPYETRTLVHDPEYAAVLQEHRNLLDQHIRNTDDDFWQLEWVADPQWRSHTPGFENHEGPSAPQAVGGA